MPLTSWKPTPWTFAASVLFALTSMACGDDAANSGGDGGLSSDDGGGTGDSPHPQYPALDLATLPGAGGGAVGSYAAPAEPSTSRTVTVDATGTQAGNDLMTACAVAGTSVTVPDAAGRIGVVNIGDVEDCDIALGADVVIDLLVIGSLPGPMHAPAHRVRIRGGQIGSLLIRGGSSDLILDGVVVNNGVVPVEQRSGTAFYVPETEGGEVVQRMVVVNSMIRLVAVDAGEGNFDGTAYLGRVRDLMFANNNIVTAGNRNSWGFRIGGGDNTLLVDNTVRVSFHKLVRMNDAPVDYVYIKGGTWMRESTLTAGGLLINDSFTQLGSTTDHVYVHDPDVYLLADSPVTFGASSGAEQEGRSWEARRIHWHALGDQVISDARLTELQGYCAAGALCDYGAGTHHYTFDPALSFPSDPWRDLPTFADDDPDNLPVQ